MRSEFNGNNWKRNEKQIGNEIVNGIKMDGCELHVKRRNHDVVKMQ